MEMLMQHAKKTPTCKGGHELVGKLSSLPVARDDWCYFPLLHQMSVLGMPMA